MYDFMSYLLALSLSIMMSVKTERRAEDKGARRGAQFATYRPPADWLGCHHATVAEALDMRSAWATQPLTAWTVTCG